MKKEPGQYARVPSSFSVVLWCGKAVGACPSLLQGTDFKTWEPKYNVPVNKDWTVEFNLPFDSSTVGEDNVYITE